MAVFVNVFVTCTVRTGEPASRAELSVVVLQTSTLTYCLLSARALHPLSLPSNTCGRRGGPWSGVGDNVSSWPQITRYLICIQELLRKRGGHLSDFLFAAGMAGSVGCRRGKKVGCVSLSPWRIYCHFSRKGPERPQGPERGVPPSWEAASVVESCDLLCRAFEQPRVGDGSSGVPEWLAALQLERQTYSGVPLTLLTPPLPSPPTCSSPLLRPLNLSVT